MIAAVQVLAVHLSRETELIFNVRIALQTCKYIHYHNGVHVYSMCKITFIATSVSEN